MPNATMLGDSAVSPPCLSFLHVHVIVYKNHISVLVSISSTNHFQESVRFPNFKEEKAVSCARNCWCRGAAPLFSSLAEGCLGNR